ncbi:hypothetical protein F5888DRAFT_1693622 [Russula emetica]|nr:hypothetical protein F5888DRAFT_1693622 [Russula emetica]
MMVQNQTYSMLLLPFFSSSRAGVGCGSSTVHGHYGCGRKHQVSFCLDLIARSNIHSNRSFFPPSAAKVLEPP